LETGYSESMPGWIGFPELLILLLVVLLVFGPKRLPEMGKQLGRGMREFKDSITGKDDDRAAAAPELPAPPPEVATPTTAREQDTTSTTTP
jgi:sec-independent protein translocase protein TatA